MTQDLKELFNSLESQHIVIRVKDESALNEFTIYGAPNGESIREFEVWKSKKGTFDGDCVVCFDTALFCRDYHFSFDSKGRDEFCKMFQSKDIESIKIVPKVD